MFLLILDKEEGEEKENERETSMWERETSDGCFP